MNPYQFEVTCDVCGEPGMGTSRCAGAAWDPYQTVRHSNPQVCADNLARKKAQLDKREAELKAKEEKADV